uniref:Uncharacterized protein n=1 Tax=Arundo donax TaxID=35708 RepID=A0A0A9GDW1_ARUDO
MWRGQRVRVVEAPALQDWMRGGDVVAAAT